VVVIDTWAHHANGVLDHRARPVLARIHRFLDNFRDKGARVVYVPSGSFHTGREAEAWTRSRSIIPARAGPITTTPGRYFTRDDLGLDEYNTGKFDCSLHPELEIHPLDYLLAPRRRRIAEGCTPCLRVGGCSM
jgi:hypothetical protein